MLEHLLNSVITFYYFSFKIEIWVQLYILNYPSVNFSNRAANCPDRPHGDRARERSFNSTSTVMRLMLSFSFAHTTTSPTIPHHSMTPERGHLAICAPPLSKGMWAGYHHLKLAPRLAHNHQPQAQCPSPLMRDVGSCSMVNTRREGGTKVRKREAKEAIGKLRKRTTTKAVVVRFHPSPFPPVADHLTPTLRQPHANPTPSANPTCIRTAIPSKPTPSNSTRESPMPATTQRTPKTTHAAQYQDKETQRQRDVSPRPR
jgi:hypothetical protein